MALDKTTVAEYYAGASVAFIMYAVYMFGLVWKILGSDECMNTKMISTFMFLTCFAGWISLSLIIWWIYARKEIEKNATKKDRSLIVVAGLVSILTVLSWILTTGNEGNTFSAIIFAFLNFVILFVIAVALLINDS